MRLPGTTAALSATFALCTFLGPAAAWAQRGWDTPPVTLSPPQSTGGAIGIARVGVDAAGNAVAVWHEPGPTPVGTGYIVRAARYDAATGRWGSPTTLAAASRSSTVRDVAVDAAGNALALWSSNPISVTITLGLSRYDAATGLWSDVTPASTGLLSAAAVAMNRAGDAVVCWSVSVFPSPLTCRRYASATATWRPLDSVGSTGAQVNLLDVDIDAAGNVHLVWIDGTSVRTAAFDAAVSSWGAPVDLATGLPSPGNPSLQLALNEAGGAVATWSRGAVLEAARRPSGAVAWTTPQTLTSDGIYNESARSAVASDGVITVAWVHTATAARTIQVARFDPGAGVWTPAADLPGQGTSAYGPASIQVDLQGNVHVVWSQSLVSPQIRLLASRYTVATGQWTTRTNLSAIDQAAFSGDVGVDDRGNATAVWFQIAGGISAPQALRWEATPAPPAVGAVTPSAATLSVPFTVPAGTDPGLAATGLDYSLDNGASWTSRSAASPLVIGGLTDGVAYTLRLRAVNAAGPGLATAPLSVRSGTDVTPSPLRVVAAAGDTLTLAWSVPAAGAIPSDYLLEGGIAPGQTLASLSLGTDQSLITLNRVPSGTFYLRVVAMNGAVRGGVSNEVRVTTGATGTPPPPRALLGLANGFALGLSWTNDAGGAAPTALILNVTGGVSGSATLPVGESFSFANVPPGTYTFTVAASNSAGVSVPSAPVTLSFPSACAGPPSPPSPVSGTVAGNIVSLTWEPPQSGTAVSGYELVVGGSATARVPIGAREISAVVGRGSYDIAVAAVNACGTSPATRVTLVVVP